MLVLLKENIESLGIIGDVVRVKDGYARNFLLPQGLVVVADESNVKALEHQKKALEKKRLAQRAAAQELSEKLSAFSCTIKRKVGQNDRLFGSVTANDIFDQMTLAGFPIEKTMIQLKDPIKALGVHTVDIRIQPEVVAPLKVWVVKEQE